MIFPTVHMNGTSREELRQQYKAARDAVKVAIDRLHDAMPHGRDYYPQGPDVQYKARNEHERRISALQGVRDELESIYIAIVKP